VTRICVCLVFASFSVLQAQQTRDARVGPEPTGTALVSGVVVSDENPDRPIARAIVTLSGAGLTLGRTTITAGDGRFTFGNLPAGNFEIRATKGGYVPASYGAKRPGRPGTPLSVADGQRSDIQIRLPGGAAIAGTVRNAIGQPSPGIVIEVVPVPRVPNPSRNVSPHTAMTDDRGMYRVYGLLPGDYLIAAIPPRPGFFASASLPGMEMRSMGSNNLTRRSSAEIDAIFRELQARSPGGAGSLAIAPPAGPGRAVDSPDPPVTYGYAPIYFPGTPTVSQASRITLRQAETRAGVDIGVDLIRTTTVRGVVTNPQGTMPAVGLSIQAADPRPAGAAIAAPVLSKSPGADGQFEYTGLAPGRYVIWARSREGAPSTQSPGGGAVTIGSGQGTATPAQLWAMAELTAAGEPIAGVTLSLQPTLRITGRLRFEGTTLEAPDSGSGVRLALLSETAPPGGMGNLTNFGGPPMPPAQVQPDGTFVFAGLVPGVYRLSATVTGAAGWWARAAMLGERDLLDQPLEVGQTSDARPIIITFSDRPATISGSLRAPEGMPAPDYFVLVFPADRALWRPGSRRVRTARPATDGGFSIRGLPAGEYLIGALTDIDPADVDDPAFLEQVAAAGIRIQLADGEQKRQDIQIAR
jgi:hypothetical protein